MRGLLVVHGLLFVFPSHVENASVSLPLVMSPGSSAGSQRRRRSPGSSSTEPSSSRCCPISPPGRCPGLLW
ncbi:hypothetical protein PF011_g19845 [Phytophthora fragariae]|uniref:RxLR effector protein n=1 Tax=Phytophthora fragariae TaxID=53985 RepID=A0A6A3J3E9_9STRA|nr:hypothetical protein PF011_g19845 [Phytophthora fragariae]